MYLGSWKIDDVLTFTVNTHTPSTGAVTDADAVPTYRVYEDETGTPILTGSTAKLDDAGTTGYYSEQITLSAANGLEKGKTYTIRMSATVGGVTGAMSHTFQIEAEVDANIVSDKTGFGLAADQSAVTVGTVTLVTTTTTNTDMRGTDSAALAATALLNTTWTDAKAAFIDHSIATVDTNLDTLLTRITAARAGYLDNLSAGAVALAATALTDVTWTDAKAAFLDHSIATVDTVVDAIKAKTDNLPDGIKKNTAITAFTFLMVDSTDHVTAKTGLTVAGNYSGDGGAVAALTNTAVITEISNGLYEIDLTAGELNYENVTLIFTASGADARVITIHTST